MGERDPLQIFPAQAACAFDILPSRRAQIGCEGLEAVGVLGDELMVQGSESHVLLLQHRLHDACQRRRVAADLHLVVAGGDARRAEGAHLDWVLRVGEALQRTFLQRVEDDDGHAAT